MMPLNLSELISEEKVTAKIQEIGQKITDQFSGEEVTAICILKGSFMYYADLVRAIDLDIQCEFIGVSSYNGQTQSSGEVKVTLDLTTPLEGKNVVLIEDIVDTGLTMNFLKKMIMARMPKQLVTTSLLLKPAALKTDCTIDHVGFEIDNRFVVGYGLDYQGYYRNLPYVAQAQDFN
ncbi:MAG: hypoxanthine phosphoribosyltransferase [Bdellovibrionales bacterium]|nr:hypoxanthine phosphoribosyltransferase [Bdellovibrionales bacterium]